MNNAIGGLTTGIIMKSHILTSHLKLKKKNQFLFSSLDPRAPLHHPCTPSLAGEPQGAAPPEHAACLSLAADLLQENHWPVHSSLYLICKLLQGKDLFLLLLLLSRFRAHQAPPSLGISRQEHWSGLPFPSPMHESEK